MPDQEPTTPNPASGAERLSLSVEAVRQTAAPSIGTSCVVPCFCFADDDTAEASALSSSCWYSGFSFADDDSE